MDSISHMEVRALSQGQPMHLVIARWRWQINSPSSEVKEISHVMSLPDSPPILTQNELVSEASQGLFGFIKELGDGK
jgi:hypothetical protein